MQQLIGFRSYKSKKLALVSVYVVTLDDFNELIGIIRVKDLIEENH